MLAGKSFVVNDVENEIVEPELVAAYLSLDIRAVAAVPLLKAGRLVAGLAVHQIEPREWRCDDVDLVGVVANRCWESIERARVEKELRASERQFRTLADAMPNLAWMAHPDGHIFWYNHRWYEYTGMAPEDMEGWGWQAVHHPDVLPSVVNGWKRSIATGEPFEMVFPLRGADGRFREFLTRVEPVRDDRGEVARWFGTNTDVTVQQEAERREKRARETAEALNRVGPVLAAELDPERLTQKITDIATEAVHAEFGAFFHNVRNETGESFLLYTLSGVDREAFSRFPMPRNTHVFGPTFRGEGIVRCDDVTKDPRYGHNPPYQGMPEGHIPVRSYLAVPVMSRLGQVIGGLFFGHSKPAVFTPDAEAIATGIAAQAAIALDNASLFEETRRASEALGKSNENLMRLNEDLNQFAYSASHDLREPLRMVSIYTQLLNRRIGPKLDEESSKYVEQVLKGASRLEALIRDLLAYTKAAEIEHEQVPVIDAGEAFRNALANLSAAIDETGARVSSVSSLPKVCMAEVHFTQLLQNLIGNAIKYRGAAAPEIHIGAARKDGRWEFSVVDNGIGIEPDFKEQIFGIFKRLHNAEHYSGTGIGLAICQRIVQRYGGRIWVESEPGRGSTFYFTVPAAD
jgi:PAS domain S-box-containing protein